MKKIILSVIMTTIMLNAWAIQTHRAINRTAYEKAENLTKFMTDAELIRSEKYNQKFEYIRLDDWGDKGRTYFTYITEEDEAMMESNQTFQSHTYKDIIEAGAILEDALVHLTAGIPKIGEGSGRFSLVTPVLWCNA